MNNPDVPAVGPVEKEKEMTTNESAVEQYDPDEVSAYVPRITKSLQQLEAEVSVLDKAFHWAKAMSKTTMVPEHFQQAYKPRGCTDPLGEVAAYNLAAAVMYGMEIGLSAMQAAQNVFVVHGKPAVYARTMAAQVRAAGYVIEPVEESDERCVWKGERDGSWAFSEWTIERAAQAGYTTNERYKKNPQEMLRAKCIAEVCRIKYQDVLLGMAYSVEELDLFDGVSVSRPVKRKEGTRGLAALREIAEEAPAQDETQGEAQDDTPAVEDAPVVTPGDGPVPPSANQLAEIRKLCKAKGIAGTAILDDLSQFMQATVKAFDQITATEAGDYINSLKATLPER